MLSYLRVRMREPNELGRVSEVSWVLVVLYPKVRVPVTSATVALCPRRL